jgi:hypothetical protein
MEKPTGPYTQSIEAPGMDIGAAYARKATGTLGIADNPIRSDERTDQLGLVDNRLRQMENQQRQRSGYRLDGLGAKVVSRNGDRSNTYRDNMAKMTIEPPAEVMTAGG